MHTGINDTNIAKRVPMLLEKIWALLVSLVFFCERIITFKAEHLTTKINVISRWGIDFRPLLNYQRTTELRQELI